MGLSPSAAETLRRAIAEAGGVEVFAIGDVEEGQVISVTVTCRGTADRVPALIDRPRAGQAVIHNHPSGDLRPSQADLNLAGVYGEDGIGVVIVDSDVRRSNWVVEPFVAREALVDREALERFFHEGLAHAMPGWELRPQQLEMAHRVADALDVDEPVLCEAGTGTGKSLAYLVPAALWALANDGKIVVSTFTRALQAQLLTSDLPLLSRGGLEARAAVLQGRNNYACRRRLSLAAQEPGLPDEEKALLDTLIEWSDSTHDGSRSDLPFPVDGEVWDRVLSDGDLTLRARCPHFASCHYYTARRAANAAHLIVVNHALLLTDLVVREEVGRGVLPRFKRLVLDEAHHLEDAATGAASERATARAVRRAILPLLDTKRRPGALARLSRTATAHLAPDARSKLSERATRAETVLQALAGGVSTSLAQVGRALLPGEDPVRIKVENEASEAWQLDAVPSLRHIHSDLAEGTEALASIEELFSSVQVPEGQIQPLLDLGRARRRLSTQADVVRRFLEHGTDRCRWVAWDRTRRAAFQDRPAILSVAPIEIAGVLRRVLWEPFPGTACTSATLTVAGSFRFWLARHGLETAEQVVFPSPFDHARQALLGLPRDLPPPGSPDYLDVTRRAVVEAVAATDGGAFVLCTSYAAIGAYAGALRAAGQWPVLAQGDAGRAVLLQRFRRHRRAVLVGTDSFWEGVSVRGEALRLVVLPRIPFRVPTEPLQQARYERIRQQGRDPFRGYSLPQAAIKLRQGYGRLIRSATDRGAVLLLDRRVHDRSYGRVLLSSLPPARRVVGPWRRVVQALRDMELDRGAEG